MEQNESYYPELITRYLSGEAAPEQIRELSEWLQGNAEHIALFEGLHKSWLLLQESRIREQTDPKQEWITLERKLRGTAAQDDPAKKTPHQLKPEPHVGTTPKPMAPTNPEFQTRIGPRVFNTTGAHSTSESVPPVIPLTDPLPDSTFSQKGSDWRILAIRIAAVAAILLVLILPGRMLWHYLQQEPVNRIMASGEVLETTLPDGTTITLNAHASITIPADFGRTARQIELQGQAYLEVAHDSALPMQITSGTALIEVRGTSFYVNAPNEGSDLEVVLVEGSVALSFAGKATSPTIISPGERAELIRSQQEILVTPNDDPNFLAWKTHRILFFDDRLDHIVQTLNNVYQSNIVLATGDLAACRMTATFNRQSLESVIRVMEATLDLHAETTETGITLSGKGCP